MESFRYDACHRLTGYSTTPAGSLSSRSDRWARTPEGQFTQWRYEFNALEMEMVLERDSRNQLVGAEILVLSPAVYVSEKHRYTLDAQGRIERVEGTSASASPWQETRRYSTEGTRVEIRRESNGKLSWLKEFSQGRPVRYTSGDREEKWTYGPSGELLSFAFETPRQQFQVSYQYGEDGRLLQATTSERNQVGTDWQESQTVSAYHYAEDGRILSREDRTGTSTDTYLYEYVCSGAHLMPSP